MRVLTTWMYFDSSEVNSSGPFGPRFPRRGPEQDLDPGIGVAWYSGDTTSLVVPIHNIKAFRPLPGHDRNEALNEDALRNYVDLFLSDAQEFEFERLERSLKNERITEYVITQPIVIERSPPFHITLRGLLTSTNLPIWIGTYMGWSVVPDHSILLFITIPGGIIIVSSATGLALALSAGLSKSIRRLFNVRN